MAWELFVAGNWGHFFARIGWAEAVFINRALEVDHLVEAITQTDSSAGNASDDAEYHNFSDLILTPVGLNDGVWQFSPAVKNVG